MVVVAVLKVVVVAMVAARLAVARVVVRVVAVSAGGHQWPPLDVDHFSTWTR